MTLAHLLPTIQQLPILSRRSEDDSQTIVDLPDSARPPVIAAAIAEHSAPALVVTSRADRADDLCAALREYLPSDRPVALWPAPEGLPYELLPVDLDQSGRRVALLDQLYRTSASPSAPILVAPAHALTQLVLSPSELWSMTREVTVGSRLSIDELVDWAASCGYRTEPLVQEPGTLARRGGIVDLFPPAESHPVRLDFFGDEVESIRTFDPHTQRSLERRKQISLLPATELPLWRLATIGPALRAVETQSLRPEVAQEWHHQLDRIDAGITPTAVDLFADYLAPARTGNGHREAGTAAIDFYSEWQSIYVDYSGKLQRAQIDD